MRVYVGSLDRPAGKRERNCVAAERVRFAGTDGAVCSDGHGSVFKRSQLERGSNSRRKFSRRNDLQLRPVHSASGNAGKSKHHRDRNSTGGATGERLGDSPDSKRLNRKHRAKLSKCYAGRKREPYRDGERSGKRQLRSQLGGEQRRRR